VYRDISELLRRKFKGHPNRGWGKEAPVTDATDNGEEKYTMDGFKIV